MRSIKNYTKRNYLTTASRVLLVAVVVLSLFIAQCGIGFNKHTCIHSGHQHLDIDLLAGTEALMICLDKEDDCCSGHSESEDCGEGCTDDEIVVHIDFDTDIQHQNIVIDAPQCIKLLTFSQPLQTAAEDTDAKCYNYQTFIKDTEEPNTRLCALLCTMLC